jgi:hypothetical protein
MSATRTRGDRVVDLRLGFDLFEAQVITESVRAAGFHVGLREMTTEGIPLSPPIARQVLMVRERDLNEVRRLVDRSFATA